MKLPRLGAGPDWKQFLGLGEQLLKQPNAAAQCQLIVDTLQSLLSCEAQVWLTDPSYPLPDEPDVPILPGAPAPELVLQVYHSRQPACLSSADLPATPCPPGELPRVVAFPISSQGVLLGVMYALRKKGPPFRPVEQNFLEALAAHAGVAMQSTRQTALKNWRHEQLALVRTVSAQVANVHDIDQLCRQVTRLIMDFFHFSHAAILTVEPGQEELLLRATVTQGRPAEQPVNYSVRLGQGMIGTAAQTGEEQVAQNVAAHPHYRFHDKSGRNPLRSGPAAQSGRSHSGGAGCAEQPPGCLSRK